MSLRCSSCNFNKYDTISPENAIPSGVLDGACEVGVRVEYAAVC